MIEYQDEEVSKQEDKIEDLEFKLELTQEVENEIIDQVKENSAELNLMVRELGMEPHEFFELARWQEVMEGDNMTPVLCVLARAFITINSLTSQNEKHAIETTDLNTKLQDLELRFDLMNAPKDTSSDNDVMKNIFNNPIVRNSD